MDIEKALKEIHDNWAKYPHDSKGGHEAVWIAKSDIAGSYEVDEEWLGMKGDGSLVWAYASGCSCWDGSYDTAVDKTIKAFQLVHNIPPENWEKAIIEFAEKDQKDEIDITPKKEIHNW